MDQVRHWSVMTILCFSGGIIFMLPFLREVYYIPLAAWLIGRKTAVGKSGAAAVVV